MTAMVVRMIGQSPSRSAIVNVERRGSSAANCAGVNNSVRWLTWPSGLMTPLTPTVEIWIGPPVFHRPELGHRQLLGGLSRKPERGVVGGHQQNLGTMHDRFPVEGVIGHL